MISSHYSAFNRQISEAVLIKKNEGKYLLNSKAEYNRCSLPSIRTSEKKSDWKLSEMRDQEFEDGVKYIRKHRKKNLMLNVEIVEKKKNVKVNVEEKKLEKESVDEKLIEECQNIVAWNRSRWEKRENMERIKKVEEQSKLEREYRLSRAAILKEEFLKKHYIKEGKTNVRWSKEKIEFKKNSWRKYRDVMSIIDEPERIELIQKLMINILERPQKS